MVNIITKLLLIFFGASLGKTIGSCYYFLSQFVSKTTETVVSSGVTVHTALLGILSGEVRNSITSGSYT